jgi:prevent-host-death family protein
VSTIDMHWQVQEAKQRFSELLRAVENEGAQYVTKHGKEIAVVLSMDEFHRLGGEKRRYKDFDDWLLNGPKDDEFADIMANIRDKSLPRDAGFGDD